MALSLVLSAQAFAGPSQYGTTATTANTKDAVDPTITNLAWRYRPANYTLTLHPIYPHKTVSKIDEAMKYSKNDDDVRRALGAFCNSGETHHDGLIACVERHKDFQGLALARIRAAIGSNEDHIARLTSGRKFDGTVEGDQVVVNLGQKPGPYTPDIPTVYDLESEYKKSGTLGGLPGNKAKYNDLRNAAKKWVQELAIHDPQAKEIKFKAPVAADPRDPALKDEKVVMFERGHDGEEVNDSDLKKYVQKKAADLDRDFKDADQNGNSTEKEKPFNAKAIQTDERLNYEAYKDARESLIGAVEKTFTNSNEVVDVKSADRYGSKDALKTRKYDDKDKIRRPASNASSRYIKFDLTTFMKTIQNDYK